MCEPDAGSDPNTFTVRSAMRDRTGHTTKNALIRRGSVTRDQPGYSAHMTNPVDFAMLSVIMPSAKRVLLLVTQADWGGVQSFLIRFTTELKKEGREVLLAAGGEGELWKEARAKGIPCHQLRHLKREISPIDDIRATAEIKRLIDEFKPDAIHLNSSKMGVLGSIAASLSKTKPWVVYRIGGWAFLEPQPEWKRWVYKTAERMTSGKKDIIITVHPGDEALAKDLHFRPRHGFRTVANGLDVPSFVTKLRTRNDARTALGIPEHAFVFGTVANAYATKALLPYLDVAAKILNEDQKTLCVILGDGPELDALKTKRDALGLHDRILLPGHRDDAGSLYPAFDVFVLPSKKEGMPWTLLEAMASGLPSVASDVGACRWMLTETGSGDAGLIVPPSDSLSLTDAMRSLKNDTERRERFSRSAHDSIQRRFTWDATYRGNRDALFSRSG